MLFVDSKTTKAYISDRPINSNEAAIVDSTPSSKSFILYSFANLLIKSIKAPTNIQGKIFLEKIFTVNYTLKYG